jgi:hypothetical protein
MHIACSQGEKVAATTDWHATCFMALAAATLGSSPTAISKGSRGCSEKEAKQKSLSDQPAAWQKGALIKLYEVN